LERDLSEWALTRALTICCSLVWMTTTGFIVRAFGGPSRRDHGGTDLASPSKST
jgi:hypothetical protein